MNNYELLFIMDSTLTDEAKEAIIAKFSAIVTDANGTIDTIDRWGVKKLAYPIARKNDGYYCLFNFTADSTVPAEIERVMNITDTIIRFIVIKK
ncbi:MAG: 30S ribosomal protein S6 [Clostridia bacterium]|nr:30S ribosomal protein S6 [Clostridia bacterium]